MSIVPLILGKTVARTTEEYGSLGGDGGDAILLIDVEEAQLPLKDAAEEQSRHIKCSNASYDLRVGDQYRDHRERGSRRVDKEIILDPGAAVIIQTQESVRLPRTKFGIVSPKVRWLERGLSNTFSKVDPGYNGRLLISLFNLGKQEIRLPQGEHLCGLSILDVGAGSLLYSNPEKQFPGGPPLSPWQRFSDRIARNNTTLLMILTVLWLLEPLVLYLLQRR